MSVPIKAGQWGRCKNFGWSVGPADSKVSSRWLTVPFEDFFATYLPSGRYVEGEENPNHDIIEVSDTDPRAPQPEAPAEPMVLMVPVDPHCIPEGYRAVRVGVPMAGEFSVALKIEKPDEHRCDCESLIRLIIEPIEPPKPPLQLVEGAWARLRSGTVVGPIERCKGATDSWVYQFTVGTVLYTNEGRAATKIPDSPEDIVELLKLVPWEGGAQ